MLSPSIRPNNHLVDSELTCAQLAVGYSCDTYCLLDHISQKVKSAQTEIACPNRDSRFQDLLSRILPSKPMSFSAGKSVLGSVFKELSGGCDAKMKCMQVTKGYK